MHHTLRKSPRFALGIIVGTIFLWALPARAQQQEPAATPATPTTTPSSSQAQPANTSSTSTGAGQESQQTGQNTVNTDRLFGVLPNYATVETEHEFGPLTVKDKFKLTADSMFDRSLSHLLASKP